MAMEDGKAELANFCVREVKSLTAEDVMKLEKQNSRIVSDFQANKLEKEAQKNWDLFYKRNETRFFKDRHWTTREFEELIKGEGSGRRNMLEVGCGVGNLVFPLLELDLNLFVYACDFSPRAVQLLKSNEFYDESKVRAFHCDITTDGIFTEIDDCSMDIVTLVFVLSAIHPTKFASTLNRLFRLLKPGGILLFRDYGLYDMAQLRFKAGSKISENFYVRQDGTRSFYFSIEGISKLFSDNGFTIMEANYVHRRTVNKKENVDVPRIFVQAKIKKPKSIVSSVSENCGLLVSNGV